VGEEAGGVGRVFGGWGGGRVGGGVVGGGAGVGGDHPHGFLTHSEADVYKRVVQRKKRENLTREKRSLPREKKKDSGDGTVQA